MVRVTGEKNSASSDADITCAGAVIRGTSDARKLAIVALKQKIREAEEVNREEAGLEELEALDEAYYDALALIESGTAAVKDLEAALKEY